MNEPTLFTAPKGPLRGRAAPRASATTDQTRVRDMFVAAAIAAIAVIAALLIFPGDPRVPAPLARPHVQAKIGCASCHANAAGAAAACTTCHEASAHASTRSAHRALAARGSMPCVGCHPAHGDAEGITATGAHEITQWRGAREERAATTAAAPLGATIPLVAAAACARCHDASSPRDPLASCLAGPGATISVCFDEHQRVDDPPRPRTGACAAQHTGARYAAWEIAREAAARSPASLAPWHPRGPWAWTGAGLGASVLSLAFFTLRRKRLGRPHDTKPALVPAARVRLPMIDTSTCLGCYACVDACPFDVLEIQRYVAVVARPADCCGVILCAQACPNGSLRIAEGATLDDRPRVDEHLESLDAPGIFVAGDLTGLPLIKNAINQGVRAVDRIASTLARSSKDGAPDLIIVGAGPAGLSAALRAKEKGLCAVCFEQGSVAASIRSFPRDKLVFDQPLDLPVEGPLWLRESTKEELLAQWTRIVRAHKLSIHEHQRITSIARESGLFVVGATDAEGRVTFARAPRLVLAIGKRGTPRTLPIDVAAGAEARVSYALADARSFAGKRVLVVGLGDTAMEAAVALARQPGTEVTISYRGADFARGKGRTIAELKALVARGRVRIVFESHLERVDLGRVTLRRRNASELLANDAVLVLIGGTPSWDLLALAGITRGAKTLSPSGS